MSALPVVRARVRPGHPWVFANEILDPPVASLEPGGAVEVVAPDGRFVGRGYANPRSLITIRLLTRERRSLDEPGLYAERLRAALALRQRVLPGRRSYRLCAGEADGLPGLVVDRYEDVAVAQLTTLGMDRRAPLLEAALREVVGLAGVVRRDDVAPRALEGLGGEAHTWFGEVPERVRFDENGVVFEADLVHGQKTGFFFDQAENRRWMSERAAGARVLDVYAHLGGWALAGLRGGARQAVAVDSSGPACALIRKNGEHNGVAERLAVVQGDARDVMRELAGRGERFELVCVDPPAFAKNRKSAGAALAAYKQVNTLGLGLVAPGGLYFASSCSHHVLPERFEEAVFAAARAARREVVLLRRGGQAPDHPILPGVPETAYLKHLVLGVA